jgi:replicative DNA helicase
VSGPPEIEVGPEATNSEPDTNLNDGSDTSTGRGQIPPIGPHPTTGVLLIGSLLWSEPAKAAVVLELVTDDDMATPSLSAVLSAVRRLVTAGTPPGPQLVADTLRRQGTLKHFAAKDLQDATTSGAQPLALREYAAAVVADALRRRIASAGVALTTAAADATEAALAPLVSRATVACLDCAGRLDQLRGESI